MQLAATSQKRVRSEPTIALINIVFLMLIFFLIAGSLAPPIDGNVTLVETADLEGREPPDALVVRADGTLTYRGEVTTLAGYMAGVRGGSEGLAEIRIVPDRRLPAAELVRVGGELRQAGAERIFIVTERGLQ